MRIATTLLAAALAAALPTAYASEDGDTAKAREELKAAREELRDLTRRIAELSAEVGVEEGRHAYAFRYLSDPDRAMIGIVLDNDGGNVELAAVTPGGPAEKAGLRSGDRIVAINGTRVEDAAKRGAGLEAAVSDEARVESTRKLIGELKPGDKVRVTYERNGKSKDVVVAAERRESWSWPMLAGSQMFNVEAFPEVAAAARAAVPNQQEIQVIIERAQSDAMRATRDAQRASEHAMNHYGDAMREAQREMRRVMIFDGRSWGGNLRMAPINPGLGRYFGTDSGVLILENDDPAFPQLKAGDVVLSVDGKKLDAGSGLMRAMAQKDAGQTVNAEVLRDRKRTVLVLTVPDQPDVLIPMPPAPPAPPAPAAPPAPRTPKAAPPAPPAPPLPPGDPVAALAPLPPMPPVASAPLAPLPPMAPPRGLAPIARAPLPPEPPVPPEVPEIRVILL